MPRGNIYLSSLETRLIISALDSMLEHLPTGDEVPDIDRVEAERDRGSIGSLRMKLEAHNPDKE